MSWNAFIAANQAAVNAWLTTAYLNNPAQILPTFTQVALSTRQKPNNHLEFFGFLA